MSLNRKIGKASMMKIARFDYSIKTGTLQYMESMLESDVCLLLDFDDEVVSYTTQPDSFMNHSKEGNWRQYTPDLLIQYSRHFDHGEVKPEAKTYSDEFQKKHALHESIVKEQTGTELKLFTEPKVHPDRLVQLRQLKAFHRYEAIPSLNKQVVQFIKDNGGQVVLSEIDHICVEHEAWVSYPMVMLAHQVIRCVFPEVIRRHTLVEVAA
ncbi:hypothetical protein AALB_2732 [Agarivorans albus MKT 106]|uniref:TnsA endonuclease N-terminal domain-containing protein n=1 Tax=Agarivorans albus MKT 106 TaxID=1331007 RepID=R9PMN6_AGAAL|nr:hypothetical protein AALB_2732 [Agarivorans albus MKT 106]